MTLCNAVNLKTALVREDWPVSRPLPFHSRTEHGLPRNRNSMQDELDELSKYTKNHLMAINKMKTKAMLCNSRTKWDFVPELMLDTLSTSGKPLWHLFTHDSPAARSLVCKRANLQNLQGEAVPPLQTETR